jgi:hypothetical protein
MKFIPLLRLSDWDDGIEKDEVDEGCDPSESLEIRTKYSSGITGFLDCVRRPEF